MFVTAFNGSPKKNSNTMQITNSFLSGMTMSSEHEIVVNNVRDKDIQFCEGCMKCWITGSGKCVINDDMNEILSQLIKSDVIIWSFPLYVHGIPAKLKAVLDRTIPLLKAEISIRENVFYHEYLNDKMNNTKHIVICGCGFPPFEQNFASLETQFKTYFGANVTMLCIYETPLLSFPGAEPLTHNLLGNFKNAGSEFSKTGNFSESTLHELRKPMLPSDKYIPLYNDVMDKIRASV